MAITALLLAIVCCCSGDSQEMKQLQTEDLLNFRHKGNLLSNGSFELGLGAEPTYPGWWVENPTEKIVAPELPVVDDTTANSGKRSLRIDGVRDGAKVILDFHPPLTSGSLEYYLSIAAKASRPGVWIEMGPEWHMSALRSETSEEWQRFVGKKEWHDAYPQMRVQARSESPEPFTIWIDDICWTEGEHKGFIRSDPVEIVLIPEPRIGMKLADNPATLKWAAHADRERDVRMELHLRDLTGDGAVTVPWSYSAKLTSDVSEGTINLGRLARGAYMAVIGVADARTHEILGVGRERFTVMANLKGVEPPVDFAVGMHGGHRGFSTAWPDIGTREYSWRGHWTMDEYYQTCYQIGLRIQRLIVNWHVIEPERGEYRWWPIHDELKTAREYGCNTLLCVNPFTFHTPEKADELRVSDKDGAWITREGVQLSEEAVLLSEPSRGKLLFIPKEEDIRNVMTAVAERYGQDIDGLEYLNEINLFIEPSAALKHLFEPAYAAFKAKAPDTPFLVNQTMDFHADAQSYTFRFYTLGGGKCTDGFTFHPYSRSTIGKQGQHFMRRMESFVTRFSTDEKKLVFGQSEIHSIGVNGNPGWDLMQRTLLDWSAGCRWSAGVISDGMYFLEARQLSPWNLRGPRAPGVGCVALNAMYDVLGGFRIRERIELDEDVLIILFEKPGEQEYAAAMAMSDLPDRQAEFQIDMTDLEVEMFDQWGNPIRDRNEIRLSRDVLYVKSTSHSLLDRIKAGKLAWHDHAFEYEYARSLDDFMTPAPAQWWAEHVRGGMLPRK